MSLTQPRTQVPPEFQKVLSSLQRARIRPEVGLENIPAPRTLAPHAVALSASVTGPPDAVQEEPELATGRFVLLHDPSRPEVWDGEFRIVTYLRAELDPQMGNDQLLASVAWTWLVDALAEHGAPHVKAGGTATRVLSENFGELVGNDEHIDIELRASWTPLDADVTSHLEAWVDMVASFAGLPPLPDGVTPMPHVRLT